MYIQCLDKTTNAFICHSFRMSRTIFKKTRWNQRSFWIFELLQNLRNKKPMKIKHTHQKPIPGNLTKYPKLMVSQKIPTQLGDCFCFFLQLKNKHKLLELSSNKKSPNPTTNCQGFPTSSGENMEVFGLNHGWSWGRICVFFCHKKPGRCSKMVVEKKRCFKT